LRGPVIVHDQSNPFNGTYDEEVVVSLSDWYHDQMPDLISGFINKINPTGAEPVPKASLMNDTQNLVISVDPGKTYMFRVINMGAFAGQYVWFEGHNMTIIEIDGVYMRPAVASMIYISAAQRYSFLLTTRNDTSANFPIVASMDTVRLFRKIPDRGRPWLM
jgi:iron transport multicopper oxidase